MIGNTTATMKSTTHMTVRSLLLLERWSHLIPLHTYKYMHAYSTYIHAHIHTYMYIRIIHNITSNSNVLYQMLRKSRKKALVDASYNR